MGLNTMGRGRKEIMLPEVGVWWVRAGVGSQNAWVSSQLWELWQVAARGLGPLPAMGRVESDCMCVLTCPPHSSCGGGAADGLAPSWPQGAALHVPIFQINVFQNQTMFPGARERFKHSKIITEKPDLKPGPDGSQDAWYYPSSGRGKEWESGGLEQGHCQPRLLGSPLGLGQ